MEHVFRKTGPSFITLTSGTAGTAIYVDGVVAKRAPQIWLTTRAFAGRLVLGDSAGQGDSWAGQLLGLSIYNRGLNATQVLEHYETWTHWGRPEVSGDEGNAALYLLDERTGTVIHGQSGPTTDLYIPEQYAVLGQKFLETPWSEFRRAHDNV